MCNYILFWSRKIPNNLFCQSRCRLEDKIPGSSSKNEEFKARYSSCCCQLDCRQQNYILCMCFWSFKGNLEGANLASKGRQLFPVASCLHFLSQLKQINLLLSQMSVYMASSCLNSAVELIFFASVGFFFSLKAN